MGYCNQIALPVQECVSLSQAKSFLRLNQNSTADDLFITIAIQAAREKGEIETGRALAQRQFHQVLDAHPYYTDTIQSQLAYPPSFYSLPLYATTLWNYSQMIKLGRSPVISVQMMRSIQTDGTVLEYHQDVDFILDRTSEPGRIFPIPGSYWPADLYVANALEIFFTAGYDPNPAAVPDVHTVVASPPSQQPDSTLVTAVPTMIIMGILNAVAFWYNQRPSMGDLPLGVLNMFRNNAVYDFAPTRG